MSAYIKLSTFEYPRHIGDIQLDPLGINDYALVEWQNPPNFDIKTQICIETKPINQNGVWKMQWLLKEKQKINEEIETQQVVDVSTPVVETAVEAIAKVVAPAEVAVEVPVAEVTIDVGTASATPTI